MIKLPLSADKRSVCFALALFFMISKGTAAKTPIQLWQIHSTPWWLVVNQEVKGHRSNFTMRPGRSRAPDNTRCWNSGGRKSWDTNPWTHTYRHLQRCTGKQKIVSLFSMPRLQDSERHWPVKLQLSPTYSVHIICQATVKLHCSVRTRYKERYIYRSTKWYKISILLACTEYSMIQGGYGLYHLTLW